MRNRFRKVGLALGGVVAAGALVLTATAASGTTSPAGKFAAQATAAHLTTAQAQKLQQEVNHEVAQTHGTQVSLNRVLWGNKDGSTIFPIPGQPVAKDAGQTVQPASTLHGCKYGWFCIYTGTHYTGTRKDYYHCNIWVTVKHAKWWSYMNNQTPGTRAVFFYRNLGGDYTLIDTPPAINSNPKSYYLASSFRILPCQS